MGRFRFARGGGSIPVISAIVPALGDTQAGTRLRLTVSGAPVTAVSIGGTPCTSVVHDGAHVTCVAPAKAGGVYDVTVTGPGGTSAPLSNGYEAWDPTVDFANARVYGNESGVTTVSDNVSQWNDRGAGAKHASNATAGERPAYVANRFSQTRHALEFDGDDDRLKLAALDALATGQSVFWVSKHLIGNEIPNFPLQQPSSVIVGQSDASIYRALGFEADALSIHNYSDTASAWQTKTFGSGYNDGTPRCYGIVHNHTTGDIKAYVNGSQVGSTQNSTYNTTFAKWDTIGAGLNGGDAFRGELAAVVVIPGVVTDVTKLTAWLRTRGVIGSYSFTRVTTTAPWIYRDGAGIVAMSDGYLYMLGGWNPTVTFSGATTTNEVWRTPLSDGVNWTQLHTHDPSPPQTGASAHWRRRHACGWLKHVHAGTEYIYVIGGDQEDGAYPADVWRSTGGASPTWERMTDAAPWGARILSIVGSYNGALYVMGGQTDAGDASTVLRDVWKSTDGGATWTQLADAPWNARGMVFNAVSFDGYLWVIGGGSFLYDPALRDYRNDVWKFDGTMWTQVLANGHSQWTQRQYHNVRVFDGKLWILNGYNATEGNTNDVYCSSDGATWTKQTLVPWAEGHADGFCETEDAIWHATGNGGETAVYKLEAIAA